MPIDPKCPVPYQSIIYREFLKVREEQARHQGRKLTETNDRAARVIFETGVNAVRDVHEFITNGKKPGYVMRVASLGTGTGKSTNAVALVAAYARVYSGTLLPREDFSAAFVVPTVQLAKETVGELSALLPAGETVAYWTSAEANVSEVETGNARLLVFTHEKWKQRMEAGQVDGFRHYRGLPRKLVIVDEHPNLVTLMPAYPGDIQTFFEDVNFYSPGHEIAAVLRKVVARMNDLASTNGQRFEVADNLLEPDDMLSFLTLKPADLGRFINPSLPPEPRKARLGVLEGLRDFLVAASQGGCFFSRQTKSFTAYRFAFSAGPGHVLLDATADLSGLTQLRSDIAHMEQPDTSFANLETVIVKVPRKWRRVRDLFKMERIDTLAYGQWVRDIIVAETKAGDDILTYAPLALYRQGIFDKAPDLDQPYDLQGRKVNTEHYGNGVGRNTWKGKNVVCLIGDYFLPRNVAIAEVHGWSGRGLDNTSLLQAEGRRVSGDTYAPLGDYLTIHEGHTLRWMKQASMRGSARNFGDDGACGPMKLVIFTGDETLAVRNWQRLYPRAPMPRVYVRSDLEEQLGQSVDRSTRRQLWNDLEEPLGHSMDGSTGYPGLAVFLMATELALVDGQLIKQRFGINSFEIPRALRSPSCRDIASSYGWSVAKAKEVGMPGRGNYLVNWQRLSDLRSGTAKHLGALQATR